MSEHSALEQFLRQEGFSSLDGHFARFVMRLAGRQAHPALGLAAALVSRQTAEGHVCLDLAEIAGRSLPGAEAAGPGLDPPCPRLEEWLSVLPASGVVGEPGAVAPLVLDGTRLYLHRYWEDEQEVAAGLLGLSEAPPEPPDWSRLKEGLSRLFPPAQGGELDWQGVAAAVALLKKLCIVTGGPGTGKTHTVVKIMALLQESAAPYFLRLEFAAPTGKAAGRLQEAVRQAKQRVPLSSEVLAHIPEQAKTIHRLLGRRQGATSFRYNRNNPLPLDVLIVDEASMIDLALMARLLAALPAEARLILLGDKDQLASVEAGAILGDLCQGQTAGYFSAEMAGCLGRLDLPGVPLAPGKPSPLTDRLVQLEQSYRFGSASGIGRLARAVNAGDTDRALACLKDEAFPDVGWRIPDNDAVALAARVVEGYRSYLEAPDPVAAFAVFVNFRLLTALRQGRSGAAGLNQWAERQLAQAGLIVPARGEQWYRGRPVMVTRNHYQLGVYNGDIGLTWPDEEGRLRVFFPAPDGSLRSIAPARLPEHETAYALTVHKSQGSEFDEVLLLLPEQDSPVLTRELLYTAVTRARSRFELWGTESVFRAAVAAQVRRGSGLRDLLWS